MTHGYTNAFQWQLLEKQFFVSIFPKIIHVSEFIIYASCVDYVFLVFVSIVDSIVNKSIIRVGIDRGYFCIEVIAEKRIVIISIWRQYCFGVEDILSECNISVAGLYCGRLIGWA